MSDDVFVSKDVEELWEELHMLLQIGIPDVFSLQRSYNALTKFMSTAMVVMHNISGGVSVDDMDYEDYKKKTREMILQNMHYNERRMLRHLALPKEKKTLVSYRDGLVGRLEQCKEIHKVLRDRLEAFKFELSISGG